MQLEFDIDFELLIQFGIVLALGLLVGIERGWHMRSIKEGGRLAGVRTFSLIGLLGALWGLLSESLGPVILGFALIAFVGLIVVGYWAQFRISKSVGLTTEISAFITFTLGILVIRDFILLSVLITVIMLLILNLKPTLHGWLRKVEAGELFAGIQFLLISVVVLPFLPDKGYGPWEALNPYQLWWMVVLVAGLSFIGYIALKTFGGKFGILLTALSGGLISSQAVTLTMAGFAEKIKTTNILVLGVVVATATVIVRILFYILIFGSDLLEIIWLPLLLMFITTVMVLPWLWGESGQLDEKKLLLDMDNPMQISNALKFGLLLAVVVLLAEASKAWFGDAGVYGLSLISGMVDIDSITLSLLKLFNNGLSIKTAAAGIVLAGITNTLIKGAIFLVVVGWERSIKLILIQGGISLAGLVGLLFI